MNIDALSVTLFEQAKRFLEKAKEAKEQDVKAPFCNAALLLAFSALEAHVNSIAEELALRPGLSVLEQSILNENEYRLKDGKFELTNKLKMYRLEDRIEFIIANFSIPGTADDNAWQQQLSASITLRNRLVHPKSGIEITESEVALCLNAVLSCLNYLYLRIFKKPYPSVNRSLHSSLSF
jgi:hypothetical protein